MSGLPGCMTTDLSDPISVHDSGTKPVTELEEMSLRGVWGLVNAGGRVCVRARRCAKAWGRDERPPPPPPPQRSQRGQVLQVGPPLGRQGPAEGCIGHVEVGEVGQAPRVGAPLWGQGAVQRVVLQGKLLERAPRLVVTPRRRQRPLELVAMQQPGRGKSGGGEHARVSGRPQLPTPHHVQAARRAGRHAHDRERLRSIVAAVHIKPLLAPVAGQRACNKRRGNARWAFLLVRQAGGAAQRWTHP